MTFQKGDWVKIHRIILQGEDRAPQVPEDTKKVPLEMWVKGYAEASGQVGDTLEVKTLTGRLECGKVIEVNPTYTHSFGEFIPEILKIGHTLRHELYGGDGDE